MIVGRSGDYVILAMLARIAAKLSSNPESIIFDEIHGIVVKTFGLIDPVRNVLKPFGKKIIFAFIFGSVAKREDTTRSDIDLFIVSRGIHYADLMEQLIKAEKIIGRPVNPSLSSQEEFITKIKNESYFVKRVIKQPKIMIVGTVHDLEGLAEPGNDRKH